MPRVYRRAMSNIVILACIGVVGLLRGREWLSPARFERKEEL